MVSLKVEPFNQSSAGLPFNMLILPRLLWTAKVGETINKCPKILWDFKTGAGLMHTMIFDAILNFQTGKYHQRT